MHDIMKRLALQAGGSHYPNVNTQQLEYFYKSVVTECADWAVANSDVMATAGPDSFATEMKKQFGVGI
jgi:hypothetical protein